MVSYRDRHLLANDNFATHAPPRQNITIFEDLPLELFPGGIFLNLLYLYEKLLEHNSKDPQQHTTRHELGRYI